jgi:hypothetical protein
MSTVWIVSFFLLAQPGQSSDPVMEPRSEALVAVVELASGRQVSLLEFHAGVEEIFEVQLLVGARNSAVSGPFPQQDGGKTI